MCGICPDEIGNCCKLAGFDWIRGGTLRRPVGRKEKYMEPTPSKSSLHEKIPGSGLVAYFSMEIAIRPEMPTYSGGLGVLAGDTLRSAADLGIPLAAFSLIHRKGYFQQHLDPQGAQTEEVQPWNPADYCTEEAARVTVAVEGRTVTLRAWRYDGRVHRLAQHMLGIFGDRARARPQHGVGFRRAVSRNNVDDLIARASVPIGFPHNIEEARVHVGGLVTAPIAQEPVQLFQNPAVILAINEIGGGNVFACMGVVEIDRPSIAVRNSCFRRAGNQSEDQRGQATERMR